MIKASSSAFNFTSPVVPPLLVGRSEVLSRISESLLNANTSVLLTGRRKIGKSSLVTTLIAELRQRAPAVLPMSMDMQRFSRVDISDFLRLLAHQLCVEVWTTIIKRPVSELITEAVVDPQGASIARKELRTLYRIFRLLTNQEFSGSQTYAKNLGGKLVLESKVEESTTLGIGRRSLESFEFLYLLDEIREIIESHGFSSIVVVCDEANHLPEAISADILCRYFEVFASRKITFCFVAVSISGPGFEELRALFPQQVPLGPFTDPKPIEDLLRCGTKHYNQIHGLELEVAAGCIERILEVSGGYPWGLQRLAHEIFEAVGAKGYNRIEVGLVNEAAVSCMEFLSMCRSTS
jgi:hypothetical protein